MDHILAGRISQPFSLSQDRKGRKGDSPLFTGVMRKGDSPLLAGIGNLIRNRDPMGGLNPKACNRPLDDIIINRFK
jgi:hypothetical protein